MQNTLLKRISLISPEWPLRIGLSFVNVYAGTTMLMDPSHFEHYIPGWFAELLNAGSIPIDAYLLFQGSAELALAVILLVPFLGSLVRIGGAVLVMLEILLFVTFIDLDGVTFRNVGLLGGTVTLVILSARTVLQNGRRRHRTQQI